MIVPVDNCGPEDRSKKGVGANLRIEIIDQQRDHLFVGDPSQGDKRFPALHTAAGAGHQGPTTLTMTRMPRLNSAAAKGTIRIWLYTARLSIGPVQVCSISPR